MNPEYDDILRGKMSDASYAKLDALKNKKLYDFIGEFAKHCNPKTIYVCDDSVEDEEYVKKMSLESGEERQLAAANQTMHYDGYGDQARDKVNTRYIVYKENLEKIIQILKKTEATLIFATTTIVPPEAAGRIVGDELIYNAAAMEVLRNHPEVIIDDQYTAMKNFPEGRRELKDVHHFPWGQAKLGYQAGDLIREVLKKEGKW